MDLSRFGTIDNHGKQSLRLLINNFEKKINKKQV